MLIMGVMRYPIEASRTLPILTAKIKPVQLTEISKAVKDNIIISIDHEGGRIQRLLKEFTHLPSLEAISNIKNHELRKKIANQSGYVSGYELSEMNIDINYSPVVDINYNKKNNLLKDRTFGNDIKNFRTGLNWKDYF